MRSVVDLGLGETVRENERLRVDRGVKEVGRMELGFCSSALFFNKNPKQVILDAKQAFLKSLSLAYIQ